MCHAPPGEYGFAVATGRCLRFLVQFLAISSVCSVSLNSLQVNIANNTSIYTRPSNHCQLSPESVLAVENIEDCTAGQF